mgnify:CR=1 FL=1
MTRDIKIMDGISEWIRERIGPRAENRGQDSAGDTDETDEEQDEDTDGASNTNDSPVCCSAASNTDLTVLES